MKVEDMINEIKFSRYVETNDYVSTIDLNEFIKRKNKFGNAKF